MNEEIANLYTTLAGKYTTNNEIVKALDSIKIDKKFIRFTHNPISTWYGIAIYCMNNNKLHLLQNL